MHYKKSNKEYILSILYYLAILGVLVYVLAVSTKATPISNTQNKPAVQYDWEEILSSIFEKRDNLLMTGNSDELENMYVRNEKNSIWALELEISRADYLQDWAARQGIQFTGINSTINVKRTKKVGRGYAFYVVVSTTYTYVYEDQPEKENLFRIGTYHSLDLIPGSTDSCWLISREWYFDPFQDSFVKDDAQNSNYKEFVLSQTEKSFSDLSEQRKKAVAYADRYAGAASDGQFGYDYNQEYPNFMGQGGDCSNYVSQSLHESGFKTGSGWNYHKDAASHSWCNASGLKSFLIWSGRANVIAQGTYNEVYKAAYELMPGDVIGYIKKGRVDHMVLVTGADSRGYTLINSHSTDRYHVPWDLGWNEPGVKFILLRVNYPS